MSSSSISYPISALNLVLTIESVGPSISAVYCVNEQGQRVSMPEKTVLMHDDPMEPVPSVPIDAEGHRGYVICYTDRYKLFVQGRYQFKLGCTFQWNIQSA